MKPLTFHFLTLFPDTITVWLTSSILGRAHKAGLFQFNVIQLRDFASDKHRTVDDVSYGGGGGMVLKPEPLVAAVESIQTQIAPQKSQTIAFTPGGKRIEHKGVVELALNADVRDYIFVCGHYEGIDQRFLDGWVDLEFSLGDFVVTGGELPALALADSMIRQLEGALGARTDASKDESFSLNDPQLGPLIEHPQYTRPPEFRGHAVPEILLSGDHGSHRGMAQTTISHAHQESSEGSSGISC